ncbi:hypothetical protein Acr_22g0002500 [Actinidia rufa]|uniref:Uncharacterized protein n=1 Tax=Actinidia rufa TaxID=165716 RepID=A0A7J0GJC8_9ERIC|nr:hypothetical protein Acr_22g0002500 [Actinidia rufa]
MKEMQLVEKEREVLEDVSKVPKDKVVEDLVHYELDEPSLGRLFLVGSNMKERERTELIEFLKANLEGMRSAMEHVKAVIEEVDKMNDANAIREVLYLSWLSNNVGHFQEDDQQDVWAYKGSTMDAYIDDILGEERSARASAEAATTVTAENIPRGPQEPPQIDQIKTWKMYLGPRIAYVQEQVWYSRALKGQSLNTA